MAEQNWNLASGTASGEGWYYSTFNATTRTFTRSTTTTVENFIRKDGISLTPGKTYTLSAYVWSNGYVSSVDLYAYDRTVKDVQVHGQIKLTSTPTLQTLTFTPKTDSAYNWAKGSIRFDNNGSTVAGTEAILYVRDVKLEEGTTATPWCGTFEEEREKAIAARGGTYNSRLTLTALRTVVNYTSGGAYATPSFAIEKANIPYINLQWNRNLYQAGTFEVQLDADDYSSSYSAFTVTSPNEAYGGAQAGSYSCDNYPDKMAYGDETRHGRICTATGHYEIGLVLKTRFISKSGQRYVLLSGLMLDSLLDGWSTWYSTQGNQSIQTALYYATQIYSNMRVPQYQWSYLKLALATADDKALAPTIATKDYTPSYSIVSLGDHFRTLLENRGFGLAATSLWYTLGADYTSNSANSIFFIKAGVDRTLQSDNPVLIGCAFGNVASEEVTIDDSPLRDGITGYVTYQSENKNLYAIWTSASQDKSGLLGVHWTRGYLTETNLYTAQDATTEAEAIAVAEAYGTNTLQDYIEERTAELDVSLLSVEEFNSLGLGDLVTVYLDATSTFETMRIVGFSEVCKEGETTRSITLGTKRLTNTVRAAKYAAL